LSFGILFSVSGNGTSSSQALRETLNAGNASDGYDIDLTQGSSIISSDGYVILEGTSITYGGLVLSEFDSTPFDQGVNEGVIWARSDGELVFTNQSDVDTVLSETVLGINVTGSVQTTDVTQKTLATFTTTTNDTVYSFRAEVTGINAGADGASYEIKGTFKRIGGSVIQIGSTLVVVSNKDNITWGGVTFDISGSNIRVRVTGLAATTINWQCFGNIKVGS